MSDQRKNLVEIVGVIAVVASLIFVGYEIRQNTVAARAAAYQAIGVATAEAFDSLAHDKEMVAIMRKPAEAMKASDWAQYKMKMTVFARLGETVLLQIEQGLLPTDAMERLGFIGWMRIFEDPKTACIWPSIRADVSASFSQYVEGAQPTEAIDCTPFDIPDVW